MAKVLVGNGSAAAAGRSGSEPLSVVLTPLLAFGLVLLAVSSVDLGLLWWPLRFGTGEWEFGTTSRTFDSLALGTTGFVFLVVTASARRSTRALRVLGVAAVVGLAALIGMLILYWLNVPVALRSVPEQTRAAVQTSVVRSTAFALLYIALFFWLSWYTWRRAGAAKGASK